MKLAKILSGIAAILLVGSLLNAATVTFTDTHRVGGDTNFYLGKFNAGLGTLTGVSVNVIYSTLTGNVSITNNTASAVTVNHYNSTLSVVQSSENDLGFNDENSTISKVKTTPTWSGVSLTTNQTATFTINATQSFVGNFVPLLPQEIDSAFFSAYISADGFGSVVFVANNTQGITTTGSSYIVNSANAGADTELQVVYTYTEGPVPVPEASTVIVQLLIVAGGVWMFVRRRRAAAVRA